MPTQAILKALTDPEGGTDFDPPLKMAKELMEKHYINCNSFVLALISDGEASYPSEGVENINKSLA